jgi:hypothetical protein
MSRRQAATSSCMAATLLMIGMGILGAERDERNE